MKRVRFLRLAWSLFSSWDEKMSYISTIQDPAHIRDSPVLWAVRQAFREIDSMANLRLITGPETGKHDGEVFACAWSPDGGFVLSAGWDGHLRLWEASTGTRLTALRVGPKPLSACAVTPDGKRWLAGSMEGLISSWDAHTHLVVSQSAVHTRPVSALHYSPDGRFLASASWDRQVSLRLVSDERQTRTFRTHEDVVTGCRFTPDGRSLMTWSHDCSLRLWDVETTREKATLREHKDRITAADVSPDGRWAISTARASDLLLWDLETCSRANSLKLGTEVRGCFFLLDGVTLLLADATGRITLLSLPDLEPQVQLNVRQPVQCAALSPGGEQLALGGDDGTVRLVAIEGCENSPLVVTAAQSTRVSASRMQKLFGRRSVTQVYACTCPACRQPIEHLGSLPKEPVPCPNCRRLLRFNRQTLATQQASC
jgi:WD40 repeat protein